MKAVVDRRLLKSFEWRVFSLALLLFGIGLFNLHSASYRVGLIAFEKQIIWVALGIVGMIFVSFLDYKTFERYANYIYLASLVLLIMVLFLGKEVSGSRSWISLGGNLTVQPSELAKIPIILALARFYGSDSDFEGGPYGLRELVKPALIIAAPVALIFLEPDLGTALTIILISTSTVLFMGVRIRSLLVIATVVLALVYPTWNFLLKEHQKERILTFVDSSRDPLGAGYNAIQSQIAVGSGRLFGKGFHKGSQTQLRFIPEQHTDFAFSVLAEEWGFTVAVFTLLLYFILILWILDTASRARSRFSMVIAFSVGAMLFWHTIINVGMVIGILPVIGVPLLLISYGGSSILTTAVGLGLVMGIRMRRFPVHAFNVMD